MTNVETHLQFFETLTNHKRLKHLMIEVFPCEICGKEFGNQNYLAQHVKREHEKKIILHVKCVENLF